MDFASFTRRILINAKIIPAANAIKIIMETCWFSKVWKSQRLHKFPIFLPIKRAINMMIKIIKMSAEIIESHLSFTIITEETTMYFNI